MRRGRDSGRPSRRRRPSRSRRRRRGRRRRRHGSRRRHGRRGSEFFTGDQHSGRGFGGRGRRVCGSGRRRHRRRGQRCDRYRRRHLDVVAAADPSGCRVRGVP